LLESSILFDEQTALATSEKEEVTGELEKLSTKLDQTKAASTKAKEEIAMLSKELADLASTQKAMDELRSEESATYVKSKAEMEEGKASGEGRQPAKPRKGKLVMSVSTPKGRLRRHPSSSGIGPPGGPRSPVA